MVTTAPNSRINVQRLLAEAEYDNEAKAQPKARGYEKPAQDGKQQVLRAASTAHTRTVLPTSHASEPTAKPAQDAAKLLGAEGTKLSDVWTIQSPTARPAERTQALPPCPADFDPAWTIAQARSYLLAKTDAAGVPRDYAEAQIDNQVAIYQSWAATESADRLQVTLPPDSEVVQAMSNWGDAIANTYAAQQNPPQMPSSYDYTIPQLTKDWVGPELSADVPANTPYPGPFNPSGSIEEAIKYVFQYADSMPAGSYQRDLNVPHSYIASYINSCLNAWKTNGASDEACAYNLANMARTMVEGYTRQSYDVYYHNNPEAAAEHARMLSANSAQTQVLTAQLA